MRLAGHRFVIRESGHMRDDSIKSIHSVRFLPEGISVKAKEGENLLNLAAEHGIHIDASCGGAGACGKCRVKAEGAYETSKADYAGDDLREGEVLACRTSVTGDLTVTVPRATRIKGSLPTRSEGATRMRLTGFDIDRAVSECGLSPVMEKIPVSVPIPTMDSNVPDLDRLLSALRMEHGRDGLGVDFQLLQRMPKILRESEGKVTATLIRSSGESAFYAPTKPRIVELEPGDTSAEFYAVAFDIGTTSVCAQLLDLRTGKVLAEAADYNDQVRFGADVINRILACKKRGGLKRVQKAVVDTMNSILLDLLKESGLKADKLAYFVSSGNSTMTHILLGIDPTFIQLSPHTPVSRFIPPMPAWSLGLKVPKHVHLYAAPAISAWVGGDIVMGTLIADIANQEKLTLLLDMGTNAEIVLGNQDFMLSASCSAGPAFEGGGIRYGLRAMAGAIEDFHLDEPDADPMIITIGKKRARGICGSGLINTIAGLFLAGVLQPDGKFIDPDNIDRLKKGEADVEYILVKAEHSATGHDITISEVDVINLLRAKGAIYAGMRTLVGEAGFDLSMVKQVIIAGSFGQSIDVEKAVTIGLLPDVQLDRFRFIGNSSLMGARLAAQCGKGMFSGDLIASEMTYIDLGANPHFMDEFTAGTFLPHTNMEYFPSVASLLDRVRAE